MNKTAKIIIGILVLICGFLIVFSNIKGNEAKKQMQKAGKLYAENQALKVEAEELTARAERLAADAVEAQIKAQAAERYAQEAMELVKKCQNSK